MFDKNLSELLSKGLMQLNIDDKKTDDLLTFVYLLEKWNKTYNITAIRNLEQMIILHIIDSASVYNFLKGNSIIDIGTGGGIPGIIFAILDSTKKVTLLDSSQKKTRFLRYAKRHINLENIEIVCERVEKFQPNFHYDVVISRAFSEVGEFLKLSGHLCSDKGRVYAMKGPRKESEKESMIHGFELESDINIDVPFLDAQRRLLVFKRTHE
ncbi:MAG: 16S rRNA (guanine(527)-N(7))-methyltransferase RsmG [Marinicellaceae bacterium]